MRETYFENKDDNIMKIKNFARNLTAGLMAGAFVFTSVGISSPSFASSDTVKSNSSINVQSSSTKLALPMKSKSYRVSSHYGGRCAPVLGAGFFHGATDMAAKDGNPLYAALDGKVHSVVKGSSTSTGTLRIDHGTYKGKKLLISYGHMWNPTKYVKVGQKVKRGQKIAEVGSSGVSNGPHLHLALKYGTAWIDPVPFYKANGADLYSGATSVVKNTNPKTCNMYVSADMGLKKAAGITSDTIKVLKRNDQISVNTGPSRGGFMYVTHKKTGKKGFLLANTINPKKSTAPKLPSLRTVTKNVRYTPKVNQNVRSYPSTAIGKSGILDTLKKGEYVTTTGRRTSSNTYYEVKTSVGTGWIARSVLIKAPSSVKNTYKTSKNYYYSPKYSSTTIYSYPSTSSSIYKTTKKIYKSSKVTSTGRAISGWKEVKYGSKTYWAKTSTIKRTTANLPKLSNSTLKNKYYKAKYTSSMMNYPSTSTVKGWKIKTLKKYSKVKMTGKRYGTTWYQVKSGSTTGWVQKSRFYRTTANLPKLSSSTLKNKYYKAKYTSSMMNYPSTSTTKGWKIKTLKKYSKVKMTGKRYGTTWYQVKSGSTTGWVQKSRFYRTTANLPKMSKTTKNRTYKAKSNQRMMNYPSSSNTKGWKIKTIKKYWKVKTTGKRYGSWYQVKSGSTTGYVYIKNFRR